MNFSYVVLLLLLFLGCSSVSVDSTQQSTKQDSTDTVKLMSPLIDTLDSNKEKSLELISFGVNFIDWTEKDHAERRMGNRKNFEVLETQKTDSSLTIILNGIQARAQYFGNARINGDTLNLYYWTEMSVGALQNIQLTYTVKVSSETEYVYNIVRLDSY